VAQTIAGRRPRRLDRHLLVIVAALIFIAAGALGSLGIQTVDSVTGQPFPCTVIKVMDGDGPVICEEQDQDGRQVQVRLRGIEARDGDGDCRLAQKCPEMNRQGAVLIGPSRVLNGIFALPIFALPGATGPAPMRAPALSGAPCKQRCS